MAMSLAERLRRKRECEKKRRNRIRENADAVDEENRKSRLCYAARQKRSAGKKKSQREITKQRLKWRQAKRRYLEKKKVDNNLTSGASLRSETMKIIQKRQRERDRVRHHRKMKDMHQKLENAK